MYKYFIISLCLMVGYAFLGSIQGQHIRLIVLPLAVVSIALLLYFGIKFKLNFFQGCFMGVAVVIAVGIITLLLRAIDAKILDYHFDIIHMRVFLKQ